MRTIIHGKHIYEPFTGLDLGVSYITINFYTKDEINFFSRLFLKRVGINGKIYYTDAKDDNFAFEYRNNMFKFKDF